MDVEFPETFQVMKASAGKQTLREVIDSGRVPLSGGGHLEVAQQVASDASPDAWKTREGQKIEKLPLGHETWLAVVDGPLIFR